MLFSFPRSSLENYYFRRCSVLGNYIIAHIVKSSIYIFMLNLINYNLCVLIWSIDDIVDFPNPNTIYSDALGDIER